MKVEFLAQFNKDLDKIDDLKIKLKLKRIIELIESSQNLSCIQQVKKLSSFKNAFRIKIGDFRVGFFLNNGVIEFARVVHRKDIYKVLP
jgi:mRNA interferase RelE/StbE